MPIMPAFPWLFEDEVNSARTPDKMAALRKVGVPYTDEDIAGATAAVNGKSELRHFIETMGPGVGLFDCDYYSITSEHEVPREARTKVELGVVKTIIGSGTP